MSRVVLWSAPRSLSTVFERSICELENVGVVHEPHHWAFWSCKQNIDALEEARKNMLKIVRLNRSEHVFFKDMAFCISGRHNEYIGGEFSDFKYTFIIRRPFSIARSMQKIWMIYDPKEKDNFLCTPTLGAEELYNLYRKVRVVDPNPIVIKAIDIQVNPR